MVILPSSISFWISPGGWPFTVQPNEKAVPNTFHTHAYKYYTYIHTYLHTYINWRSCWHTVHAYKRRHNCRLQQNVNKIPSEYFILCVVMLYGENSVGLTSLTVPTSFLAMDLALITRAILITASRVMLPLCLIFFTFFLSRGGSFNSFSNIAEAVGTIVGVA